MAKDKKLFCMEAMWTRFNPLIREVKKLIDGEEIGEIISFSAVTAMSQSFDADGRLFNSDLGGFYTI